MFNISLPCFMDNGGCRHAKSGNVWQDLRSWRHSISIDSFMCGIKKELKPKAIIEKELSCVVGRRV